MPAERPDWDDLRLVLEVARTGGLGPASARLGLNASTVFRRLGALEARLGLTLFERHRSGYAPTPAGREMVAVASRVDEEVGALTLRLAGRTLDMSGEVRITTNDTLLVHLLTPVFASFRAKHPEIRLDIVVTNESLNLARRDADIAVRATDSPPDTLVGRRIAPIRWAIYARRPGLDGQDLAALPWVGLSGALAGIWPTRILPELTGADRVVYTVSTVLGLREAIEAGIGIGPLPCFIGDQSPHLMQVVEPRSVEASALWLLTHADLRASPRVRVVMDHLGLELGRLLASRPAVRVDQAPEVASES